MVHYQSASPLCQKSSNRPERVIILAAGEKIKKAVAPVEVGDFADEEEAVFAKLTHES